MHEHFFKGKRNGVFIDIGAYDGIHISNTYFFEKEMEWSGICIEPMPRAYGQLKTNRSCVTLNCAVGSENGIANFVELDALDFPDLAMLSGDLIFFDKAKLDHLEGILKYYNGNYRIIPLPVRTLNDILLEQGVFKIDFLSIDIEGGELDVLSALDFNTFKIHVMTVENNAREANTEIRQFLESKGFCFITRIEQDEIYENKYWK